MRLLRGRAADPVADYERTKEMTTAVASQRQPALRVWTPHRLVAFGRRDAASDGYERACDAATDRDYAVIEREVGGRAVAYTGSTIAFALAEPTEDGRAGIQDRYAAASDTVRRALAAVGVDAREGEPPDSFCPGTHSLQASGKLVGLAQRAQREVALTAGIVVVCDHDEIGAVLEPVYEALGVPFDPETVGSVARAGGPSDPQPVIDALEDALVGERTVTETERIE